VPTRKRKTPIKIAVIEDDAAGSPQALEENIEAIKNWERAAVHHRSRLEQLSDAITRVAASAPVLIAHVIWFAFWILANLSVVPGVRPFDPFPFPLLTMTVSLEAIFLSLFVLASQNRMAHQADKRANLDLQIDLLAEREMTVVLQLLQEIAAHLKIPVSVTREQVRDLVKKIDVHTLTNRMEEFPEGSASVETDKAASAGDRHTGLKALR
jgi:uncharacterized membrane protein